MCKAWQRDSTSFVELESRLHLHLGSHAGVGLTKVCADLRVHM